MAETRLDLLKKKIKEFEELQSTVGFGAGDTEPDYHWHRALKSALDGRVFIPRTGEGWELYTASYPVGQVEFAAAQLLKKAKEVVEFILETKIGEAAEIRKYVEEYAWRVM